MKYNYKEFFPHDTIRPQQDNAIQLALEAFLEKKKRFVVLELGTGCGKSAIGVTVGRYLHSINQSAPNPDLETVYVPGTYVLTTQKVLQDQYMKDFSPSPIGMRSIKSATNFTCGFYKESSCADSLRILQTEKPGTPFWRNCIGNCVYKKEKEKFINAPIGVTNFSYFLAETMYGGKLPPKQLIVVDEAHNTEAELSKFVEIAFTEKFTIDVLKLAWPEKATQVSAMKWIKTEYHPALNDYILKIQKTLEKFKGLKEKLENFKTLARQVEMLDKHFSKINRFLEMYSESNWIMNLVEASERTGRKFEFKPVDVGPFSEELLFRQAEHVILMSATIVNKDVFCKTIGIPEEDVAFLSIDSPFPIENRPVYYAPVGAMTMAEQQATLPKMAEMVALILEQHKGEKGIIHTHTFKIAKYLKANIKSRRLLVHHSLNREEIVDKHCKAKNGTVLLSPSLSEGIDLKDNLSRFQIICKIPYPYLGDKLVRKRMAKYKEWYGYQTAKSIVQSAGRSVRNDKDHAITYILDSSWDYFFKRNRDMFPESFINAIQD